MSNGEGAETATIETRIPARLDRLPWSNFHWLIVIGLGTVWILDGLEVTIVGSVGSRLTEAGSGIPISTAQIGTAAAFYVAGACVGALFFGQLTDRFGRKKLFIITLGVYIVATAATAFSFAPWYFFAARFFTGAGIGGEYAAINSAIDELIPARVRGRVDLIINGSYWLGSAAGSAAALFFLDTGIFSIDVGWRLAFGLGVVLGFTILIVRRNVPESPRWLFIHGREEEAEAIVDGVESDVEEETGEELPEPEGEIKVRQRESIPFREIARTAFKLYPKRAVLGLALFVGQAFIYNGVTFNLGTLFTTFFDVSSSIVPVFIIIYALGNFLGPVLLGRLFDTLGRKPMIAGTYLGSAAASVILAVLFVNGVLGLWAFEAMLVLTFFLASAGASAAYLTVSEIFPMETRALAIAFFYAVGTAIGGITGPLLFGHLIESGSRDQVIIAFLIGAGVMAIGGVAELFFGVKAEQAELEDIAQPLTADEAEEGSERSAGEGENEGSAAEDAGQGADEEDREASPRRVEAGRLHAEARETRARAAEHRAATHELRARPGSSDDRGEAEELLAEIADLRAASLDERADAAAMRAEAEEAGEDEAGRAAADEAASAAEERGRSWLEKAEALAADNPSAAKLHEQLAAAADEGARAREQRSLAARARAQQSAGSEESATVAGVRAEMHDAWADLHETRAEGHAMRAADDPERAARCDERATAEQELGLAAEERLHAAERRAEAADAREGSERTAGRLEDREEAQERRREDDERRRRIAARVERRRRDARVGMRRFRPGPGSISGSPGMGPAPISGEDDAALDREIESIAQALHRLGTARRDELAREVGARYWGPGRFSAAVREAASEGMVRRVSRSVLAAPDEDGHGGDGDR
jgi:MFS family permease